MHWEVLIVPLIALGVWILGTLFRPEEDERAKQRRRGPLEGGQRVPPRRPVTDLDRFLEEARRRREAAERPRPAPPPNAVEPPPRVTRPPLPQDRPSREPPRRPRPAPPTPSRRPPTEVPVARPVILATPEPAPVVVVPVVTPVAFPEVPPPASHLDAPPHARGPALTPVLAQVAALLRSPQAAGAALVLREIFDQPLCRRRR